MKAGKIIMLLGYFFIVAPIWFYLMYKILVAIHATELMFFLFWVYVPMSVLVAILSKVSDNE